MRSTALRLADILSELSGEFVERREALRVLVVGLLSGSHVMLLGPTGTGKSRMVGALAGRVTGAATFTVQLDAELGKEELLGPVNIARFERTGEWVRDGSRRLPEAVIAFCDEIGKAGPAVLNPLLTLLEERCWDPGDGWVTTPLLSAIGATNETLTGDLVAIADRFTLRVEVGYIRELTSFATLLHGRADNDTSAKKAVVSLSALLRAVNTEVPAVRLPEAMIVTLWRLRDTLAAAGVVVSDRRWKTAARLLQAHAYLSGRSAVTNADLEILTHSLWNDPIQRPIVCEQIRTLIDPDAVILETGATMLDRLLAEQHSYLDDEARITWALRNQPVLSALVRNLAALPAHQGHALRGKLIEVQAKLFMVSLQMSLDDAMISAVDVIDRVLDEDAKR